MHECNVFAQRARFQIEQNFDKRNLRTMSCSNDTKCKNLIQQHILLLCIITNEKIFIVQQYEKLDRPNLFVIIQQKQL
jgi:hypothetical protein